MKASQRLRKAPVRRGGGRAQRAWWLALGALVSACSADGTPETSEEPLAVCDADAELGPSSMAGTGCSTVQSGGEAPGAVVPGAVVPGAVVPGAVVPGTPLTLFAIGDSTMADYDEVAFPNQRGWGQQFRQFIVDGALSYVNAARNGRSSKSFYVEGLWDAVKGRIEPGDRVLVQFAHNDEGDDGLEGPDGRGTEARGAFTDYLRLYVDETRALGGVPILVTPVVRRYFTGATIRATGAHDLTGNGTAVGDADYVAAMKEVATEKGVDLVDMTASTKALVETYGPADSKSLIYVSTDDTHLQPLGATLFAQLAASEMIDRGILASYLDASADLVVSPPAIDFGDRFVSTALERVVSITGLSIAPDAGTIFVSAPEGFVVADSPEGSFGSSLDLAYSGGSLPPTNVIVRFLPTSVQDYAGTLRVESQGGNVQSVSLAGTGVSAPDGAEETVTYALTSDANCSSSTGFSSCSPETVSGLYVQGYQAVGTAGVSQRLTILNPDSPNAWPAEIDIDPMRYVEFSVGAGAGRRLVIDEISLGAGAAGGSGMAFRILYDRQASFAAPTVLGDYPANESNSVNPLRFTPVISLEPDETLFLRVYPYYKSAATGKYLVLQNLVVHGLAD